MPALKKLDAQAIINGKFEIVQDHAGKDEILAGLRAAFLDGIERFEGAACRRAVETDGLEKLHLHFPVEKVDVLEDFIMKRMREKLYYWSYQVGAGNLSLPDPFYIDYLIVLRIHYPHLVARKGGEMAKAPYPFAEKMRLALATSRDPSLLVNHVAKTLRKRQKIKEHRVAYNPVAYHGEIPNPARAHGPHIDTWYGHSYDGMNMWLSIAGVDEDNTVIIYPEMFGRDVPYDKASMYLAPGVALPKPHKILMNPGDLLLFNPEMLHGTQVNISENTRLAVTTRLNPKEPVFNDDAPFNFEHWYSSVDLKKKRFSGLKLFPANRHQGEAPVHPKPEDFDPRTSYLTLTESAPKDAAFRLCDAAALKAGEKLIVDGPNLKIMLVRTSDGVKAYDRRCPHRSVDMADGYHDAKEVFCPGHGVAFSLADGASKCSAFKLKSYKVAERDGGLYLERSGVAASAPQMATAES